MSPNDKNAIILGMAIANVNEGCSNIVTIGVLTSGNNIINTDNTIKDETDQIAVSKLCFRYYVRTN